MATTGTYTSRQFIPNATYVLPVDEQEVDRLLRQHRLIKSIFNNRLLLPPHSRDGNYEILDSATGSATWLMDLASEYPPSIKIHGTDIEGNRFPTSHPSNVSFSLASILELPQAWTNRFDYVHQRLLMCALKRDEWPIAVREILRTLKPGGWAQLGEYGFWGLGAGPQWDAILALYSQFMRRKGLVFRVFAEIPELLCEAGFRNVQVERRAYSLSGEKGEEGRRNLIDHLHAVKPQILQLGLVGSEEELDELISGVEREWALGDVEAEIVYTWGQKPADL